MEDEILEEARIMLDLAISSLQRAGHDTEQFERTVSKIKAQQALVTPDVKNQGEELKCGMKHNEPNCNCEFKHCQEQGW